MNLITVSGPEVNSAGKEVLKMLSRDMIGVKRALDFLLYVAISSSFIIIVIFTALHGVGWPKMSKWIGFVFLTSMLFGLFIKASRRLWNRSGFRLLIMLLFAGHVVGYWSCVGYAGEFRPIWFYALVPELAVFIALRNALVKDVEVRHPLL